MVEVVRALSELDPLDCLDQGRDHPVSMYCSTINFDIQINKVTAFRGKDLTNEAMT